MKKVLYAFSFLMIAMILLSFRPPSCQVNYNGIYAIKLDDEHSAVLRFYEDGTVLASTSVNDYMEVMTWFNKENKDMVLKGKYKIKKCDVTFTVSGMTGEQSYEGSIGDNMLNVTITDKDSKKHTQRSYVFFAL